MSFLSLPLLQKNVFSELATLPLLEKFLSKSEILHLKGSSKVVKSTGLVIRKTREFTTPLVPADTQAKKISQEFPLWWFFELSVDK